MSDTYMDLNQFEASVRKVINDTAAGTLRWQRESQPEGMGFLYSASGRRGYVTLRTRSPMADPVDLTISSGSGDKQTVSAYEHPTSLDELVDCLRELSSHIAA